MNAEMTKAILDGRKTQTRRVAKVRDVEPFFVKDNINEIIKKHSKYQKDEVIWVREPVRIFDCYLGFDKNGEVNDTKLTYNYVTDDNQKTIPIPERFWLPNKIGFRKRKLPSWMRSHRGIPNGCIKEMARIFLKITDVRVDKNKEDGGYSFIYDYKRIKNDK